MTAKKIIKLIFPPILFSIYHWANRKRRVARVTSSSEQDLGMYWSEEFSRVLDTWGEGNVWDEIQLLMAARKGSVLDIACGTGKTMEILSKYTDLQFYGCDISDALINKAAHRGIEVDKLKVCDATDLPYSDKEFEWAYSIGSLEHFTEDGIDKFLEECSRVVGRASFHQHPVSRSGSNEGWITSTQSYHNNSVEWWLCKYHKAFKTVIVLDSAWQDEISLGKWFICSN